MATYWENSCSFGLRYVSWYKYLIVSLVFSHLGFWSGNLFLIAPFPDLCLLVPCFVFVAVVKSSGETKTNKFCFCVLLLILSLYSVVYLKIPAMYPTKMSCFYESTS